MKFTERFLIIFIGIGVILRFKDNTSGIFVQSTGTLTLGIFYMFLSFFLVHGINYTGIFKKISYTNTNAVNAVTAVLSGFVFAYALLATMFVAMSLPMSGVVYKAAVAAVL